MSKRDGKMYLAARLVQESESSMGLPVRIADDKVAGAMFVFWTKTAARETYGRNVKLIELALDQQEDENSHGNNI